MMTFTEFEARVSDIAGGKEYVAGQRASRGFAGRRVVCWEAYTADAGWVGVAEYIEEPGVALAELESKQKLAGEAVANG